MFKIFKVLVKAYLAYAALVITFLPYTTMAKPKAMPVSDAIHGYHVHHMSFLQGCGQAVIYLVFAAWIYFGCRATWKIVKSLIKDFA